MFSPILGIDPGDASCTLLPDPTPHTVIVNASKHSQTPPEGKIRTPRTTILILFPSSYFLNVISFMQLFIEQERI